ncbi:unnamed protein product [Rotaria sordida]|uniref:G-protein coupled receptors family 2 profile 2 domain-containing protein n=1 Tax=Rotaria sordida TaxID=392033 RepID=A0A814SB20_9BILA|nr:unnamed protein product [Rotaria sordida]CAF1378585.1 unnamed protein product [Rotaria sordida]
MMMVNVFIYLFLFQISFVLTNQISETSSSSLTLVSSENVKYANNTTKLRVGHNRNRANVPQSLTLLMNFKDDGTTSFKIMQGSQIVYVDNGLCQHGQLFDPTTGRCRDIYCQEINYKFNGTTCIPDKNKTILNQYKRMSDIDLALTMIISPSSHYPRGNFSKHLNAQMNTTCTNDWMKMFHDTLHTYLNIDYERIIKIHFDFKEYDDRVLNKSMTNSKLKNKKFENSNSTHVTHPNDLSHDKISETLSNNKSIIIKFHFSITDRNSTSSETLTGLHVVTLLLLASEFHAVIDLCQKYSMKVEGVSIISDKNKTQDEFCSDPDVMHPTKNGIIRRRIRSDGEVDYVVDVPELDTTYESGDYTYIFMVSTLPQKPSTHQSRHVDTKSPASNSTPVMKLVSVCNRQPRIVGRCPDSLVMRIALCEVDQYKNFSIQNRRTKRLYTNREYRYDYFRPDLYIVVCKHDTYNGTTSGKKLGFVEKAPGILSTIATFLSIFALAISLITFTLFSSLRNLPGCNTINLIIALMIGEILFLSQSLTIMTTPSVCLLFALGIHFFYLASFFWMNVMAFDLWKTFHKGFSLYIYEIRERLPFYALYAWGMPVIIVLIGIILDAKNARLKPCYGRFFRGCYDVCFRTKNDTPLQGCWIESALMRFVLFGCPVAIILIINFILYALTVRSIRRGLKNVRVQVERKFQRKKQVVPGEHDVKIYMRMAVLAGFGWTIGFILFLLPDNQKGFKRFLVASVKYLFILLNATPGLFIFGVYVCNRRVFTLYRQLLTNIYEFFRLNFTEFKEFTLNHSQIYLSKTKNKIENFNNIKNKQKQENTQMKTLPESTTDEPSKSSNKTTLTRLLSEQSGRSSSSINSSYQTLNLSTLEK